MPGGWYVKIQGKRAGPMTAAQLKGLARRGQVGPTDLVRQEGGGPWVPAGRVKGLFPVTAASSGQSVNPTAAGQSVSPAAAEPSVAPAAPAQDPAASAPQAPPVQASTDEPNPVRTVPPALPQVSEPPPAAPAGFRVLGDSPTDRVLRRGRASRGRAWWNSTAVLGATAAAMLIAVSAAGIAMIRSGNERSAAPSPDSEPVADKAAGTAAEPSAQSPETAAASTPTSTEAKKWDLGIEGLEGLEELGILDSPGEKPRSAEQPKPEKPKPAEVAAKTSVLEPDEPPEASSEDERLAASDAPGEAARAKPQGEGNEVGMATQDGPVAESDEEPDGDVSQIRSDIAALGGGESDLDYGGDAPPAERPEKPAPNAGQKRGGQRAGGPQQRDGNKDGTQRSGGRPQDGQKGDAQRGGGDKGSDAKPAQKPSAKRKPAKK